MFLHSKISPSKSMKNSYLISVSAALIAVAFLGGGHAAAQAQSSRFEYRKVQPGLSVIADTKVSLSAATLPTATFGQAYSYDFKTLLTVSNETNPDTNQVAWGVEGTLPAWLSLNGATGVISGSPDSGANSLFTLRGSYKGHQFSQQFRLAVVYAPPKSCLELKHQNPAAESGWHTLTVGGESGSYYCDMASSGGGWTRVVLQYESTPVLWTGAVNGNSYSLTQKSIPVHTEVGFGKDGLATDVDFVEHQYSTSDIALKTVIGKKTGFSYQLHREINSFYDYHNPGGTIYANVIWNNTLTLNKTGVRGFNWSFSPQHSTAGARGYGYKGDYLEFYSELYGWSVWVR